MSTLRILIADDEAPARNRLRELISDFENMSVVAEAKNGLEALQLAEIIETDIVLLDIRMPQMDGVEAAAHLQKLATPPAIIFTTAYDNYAVQAFELNAIDYVLKPVRSERLKAALLKAQKLRPEQVETLKPLQSTRTHFSISERGKVYLVPVNEVIYLRAELKYITVRTAEREFLMEDSLTSLEQEFSEHFVRLHRNALAAKRAIAGYEKHAGDDSEHQWVAILKGVPETLPISRRQHHVIKELILQNH